MNYQAKSDKIINEAYKKVSKEAIMDIEDWIAQFEDKHPSFIRYSIPKKDWEKFRKDYTSGKYQFAFKVYDLDSAIRGDEKPSDAEYRLKKHYTDDGWKVYGEEQNGDAYVLVLFKKK